MQDVQPSLFARDDTLLGVCQGLGEDLGINPLWLRLALIPLLFFYPAQAIGLYLAAGAIVLLSRLLFPPSLRAQREDCAAALDQREEKAKAGQRLEEPTDVTPVAATEEPTPAVLPIAA